MAAEEAAEETAGEAGEEVASGSVRVKKALLAKAIRAITQVVAKRNADANPLFESASQTMLVVFAISNIPRRKKERPYIIRLPHPLYSDTSEICFFSKDPQKKYKELLLDKFKIPGLTKVIGFEKLKKQYKTYEDKRALADAFDLFLCDSEIYNFMPQTLGATFYRMKHKAPIPVKLSFSNPLPKLDKVISGTAFRIPAGPCVGVKIGRCGMPEEHLLANAVAVIATVLKHLADNPVQSITIQATDAPALPVWRRPLPPGALVEKRRKKTGGNSDASSSSAASDAGAGASETEGTGDSEVPSDAGDTLSTRDTVSELDTTGETTTDLDSMSELDSQAGDVDDVSVGGDLPLLSGLKSKKRRRAALEGKEAAEAEAKSAKGGKRAKEAEEAKEAKEAMGPPAAKKKKAKT